MEFLTNPELIKQGIFAVLFIGYLFWKERQDLLEKKFYRQTIETFVPLLTKLKDDIDALTKNLDKITEKIDGCDKRWRERRES